MIKDIHIEPFSQEGFAPNGWLLTAGDTPDFERPGLMNCRLPFNSDANPRMQVMRYSTQRKQLSRFERHLNVTEARSPDGHATAILFVAGDPAQDALPDVELVRVFYLDG